MDRFTTIPTGAALINLSGTQSEMVNKANDTEVSEDLGCPKGRWRHEYGHKCIEVTENNRKKIAFTV